ncbi:hypothetical protein TCAL_09994 [Tigriopus californicus]|uniref:Uncharacterized protein n=1 Tax=Tigriopus californicus TaxID=6832 RepID=A0A553PQ34_TIGCA|nr:uncharacterized protein LOC131882558 [Tigriopus californicus]TRY79794.1 hypothetical protein TCAL_09994 [Tigriopus californicus]|eukprot:TCALIF_09994-PA protein Name:"Protein of unknown function" AED:0.00 eAED:0.00 QI:439/1/1/1/1/1/3/198/203
MEHAVRQAEADPMEVAPDDSIRGPIAAENRTAGFIPVPLPGRANRFGDSGSHLLNVLFSMAWTDRILTAGLDKHNQIMARKDGVVALFYRTFLHVAASLWTMAQDVYHYIIATASERLPEGVTKRMVDTEERAVRALVEWDSAVATRLSDWITKMEHFLEISLKRYRKRIFHLAEALKPSTLMNKYWMGNMNKPKNAKRAQED